MLQHQAAFPEPFHDAARVQLGKPGRGQVGGDDEGSAVGMALEDNLLQLAADEIQSLTDESMEYVSRLGLSNVRQEMLKRFADKLVGRRS